MHKNKSRQKESSSRHYQNNKAAVKLRARNFTKAQRILLRDFVREEKEKRGCSGCDGVFPHYVLDFDHVLGGKVSNICDMVRAGVSFKTINLEIEKCEVVCANCHRARTWQRKIKAGGNLEN